VRGEDERGHRLTWRKPREGLSKEAEWLNI